MEGTWSQRRSAITVGAALLGLALGAPEAPAAAGCSNPAPSVAPPQAVAQAVRCEINKQRRRHGRVPLRFDARLTAAAAAQASALVQQRFFAHDDPDGTSPADRAKAAGYTKGARRWVVGEALAWGSADRRLPAGTVRALFKSAPHRRTLLMRSTRDIGIAAVAGNPRGFEGASATYAIEVGREWR